MRRPLGLVRRKHLQILAQVHIQQVRRAVHPNIRVGRRGLVQPVRRFPVRGAPVVQLKTPERALLATDERVVINVLIRVQAHDPNHSRQDDQRDQPDSPFDLSQTRPRHQKDRRQDEKDLTEIIVQGRARDDESRQRQDEPDESQRQQFDVFPLLDKAEDCYH